MNYMTYCWTKSGLDSCQKVGVVIAHLPAAEWTALLPPLRHETPLQGPSRRRTGSLLTARRPGQRLLPTGQGSLHCAMSYEVENSPKGCIWGGGGGGELLQSVKLGLMMVSWCGVIVWRWEVQVVQISLQNCQWFSWFWKVSLRQQQNATCQSESWQWILSGTQNWKCQNSAVCFVPLCANIVQRKSEICYNLIDCYYVFVDCVS